MSNFMDGYSTNSQERREAEADAEWRSRLLYHEATFHDYFLSLNGGEHGDSVVRHMSEFAADAFTETELGELIRAALRTPAMRKKYAAQIEAAAYAYATSAAE
jgi:hypothetical protein